MFYFNAYVDINTYLPSLKYSIQNVLDFLHFAYINMT